MRSRYDFVVRRECAAERIETERLVLLRPQAGDVGEIFSRYASDPEVTRFVGWPRHRTVGETAGFLAFCEGEWGKWPAGPYLIRSRVDGTLLGSTGLGFESESVASTGYVLAWDAWGKGYASEALAAMVELARGLGVDRLYALCHVEHVASRRVLEKGGFAREALLPKRVVFPNSGETGPADVFCYGMKLGPGP